MAALLAPRQLGYGVKNGAEAAVHAARLYFSNLNPNTAILKLDFQNAFNSIRRDKMLEAVQKFAPDLTAFVHSAYSSPSTLFWGDRTFQSAEGVQQGDPLGPLLFCLSIHELCSHLKSEFCLFYLDDGTLGGSKEDVLHGLDVVEREGADLGLCLNNQKSEVICDDIDTKDALLLSLQGARVVDPLEASLLGSSLGDVSSISTSLREKITLLESMGGRLKFLFTHDALLLLRHSFAIPKLLYNLRTSPCFLSPVLQEYDNLLKSIVSDTVNIYFCEDDPAWIQTTLPEGVVVLVSGVQCSWHPLSFWPLLLPVWTWSTALFHLISTVFHSHTCLTPWPSGLMATTTCLHLRVLLGSLRGFGILSRCR